MCRQGRKPTCLVLRQEGGQVLLPWLQQHSEVAAVDDFRHTVLVGSSDQVPACVGERHEVTKRGAGLRRERGSAGAHPALLL